MVEFIVQSMLGALETPHLAPWSDIIVVGSGAGGAVVAAELAERTEASILLLEAGPDYGSFSNGRWPAALCDARTIPSSHDWGYRSGDELPGRDVEYSRARVVGGCTAHNGAIQVWGHRADYDGWADRGNPGWSTDELIPLFREAEQRLGVHTYKQEELTPFQETMLAAAPTAGLPVLKTINDLDESCGAAPETVNIHRGVRWNSAFAWLDPVRGLPNLTIGGNVLVDRLRLARGRVEGVEAIVYGTRQFFGAPIVILCAGAYGSPAILQRSGIGHPDMLHDANIETTHSLQGVGANLHDQPYVALEFAGSDELRSATDGFVNSTDWAPDEQVLMKAPSSRADRAFDMHVFPWSPPAAHGGRRWFVGGACLIPESRGELRVTSADPEIAPIIDNRFLTDGSGHDRAVLRDVLTLVRELTGGGRAASLLGQVIGDGAGVLSKHDTEAFIDATVSHYWHPAGTCRMGPADDPNAVVDSRGRLHGIDGLLVADCSLMPLTPRGLTHLPTSVIGLRISRWLAEDSGGPQPKDQ